MAKPFEFERPKTRYLTSRCCSFHQGVSYYTPWWLYTVPFGLSGSDKEDGKPEQRRGEGEGHSHRCHSIRTGHTASGYCFITCINTYLILFSSVLINKLSWVIWLHKELWYYTSFPATITVEKKGNWSGSRSNTICQPVRFQFSHTSQWTVFPATSSVADRRGIW